MRLLHPKTIQILESHPEFPKTHLAHCWSECFKFLASKKSHPKMFIDNDYHLGQYLAYLYATATSCNLDKDKVFDLNQNVQAGFMEFYILEAGSDGFKDYFDDNYLFSDACSLYYKGINIFEDIFGNNWRKYCPVISLKEIKRQVDKTLKV